MKKMMSFMNYLIYIFYLTSWGLLMSYLYMTDMPKKLMWDLYSSNDLSIILSLELNYESLLFLFTVCSVFSSVYHYAIYYVDLNVKRFLLILSLFAISMMMLICGGNVFTCFVGWDGLGVTSFLLIMFYSSNMALKASMHTFILNRLGDCFFLIFIFFMMCKFPSLNATDSQYEICTFILCFMLVFLSLTKSAQAPFSSWLTKAMEAPTPVSALVHSSTLVTAGIYLMFVYRNIWMSSSSLCLLLLIVSSTTILLGSLAGILEKDLKKIVAYSTLSQLGFIMFLFSLHLFYQGFMHLIMHAFIKSLLFMSSGYVIHNSSGWQDIRLMSLNYSCSPTMVKFMIISVMSLTGMPFMSGFYSKDVIMDFYMNNSYSVMIFFFLILSFMLTTLYSFRVCYYLSSSMKSLNCKTDSGEMMIKSMLGLFGLSMVGGSLFNWIFLPSMSSMDFPKIMIFFIMIFTVLIMWNMNFIYSIYFTKMSLSLDNIMEILADKMVKSMQMLLWLMDLMSIVGSFLKKPSKWIKTYSSQINNNFVFFFYFKEFFFYMLILNYLTYFW